MIEVQGTELGTELRESRVLDSHLVLYTIGLFSLSGFILLYTIIIFFAWCNAKIFFRVHRFIGYIANYQKTIKKLSENYQKTIKKLSKNY